VHPESRYYPYPERPAIAIESYLETLSQEPKFSLTPEEKDQVLTFEHELTCGSTSINSDTQEAIPLGYLTHTFPTGETLQTPSLESTYAITIQASNFFLEYFLTDQGKQQLSQTLNQPIDKLDFANIQDISQFLSRYDYAQLTQNQIKQLSQLEGDSEKHAQEEFIKNLEQNNFQTNNIPLPHRFSVIRNPDELIQKINQLKSLKRINKAKTKELKGDDTVTSLAKITMLNIHRRRINVLLAESGNYADIYARQCLTADIPLPLELTNNTHQTSSRQISRRDKFIHGSATNEPNHDFGVLLLK